MLKDFTLGQYYVTTSPIHGLDSRTKLIGLLLYTIALFFINNLLGYLIAATLAIILILLSKVPVILLLRSIRPIMIILIFTAVVHLFFTSGQVRVAWGPLKVTDEGLILAFFTTIRLAILVIVASLLTYTTTPLDLSDGLEVLLRPLARLGVPAHELAMMVAIAIRFVPTMVDEADKIMKAQMARGARFGHGGIYRGAKNMIPLLIPLLVSAFRRADDLAIAMEARCYRGGQGRTRMKEPVMAPRDYLALGIMALWVGMALLLRLSVA